MQSAERLPPPFFFFYYMIPIIGTQIMENSNKVVSRP